MEIHHFAKIMTNLTEEAFCRGIIPPLKIANTVSSQCDTYVTFPSTRNHTMVLQSYFYIIKSPGRHAESTGVTQETGVIATYFSADGNVRHKPLSGLFST